MKRKYLRNLIILLVPVFTFTLSSMAQTLHGFKLTEKKFVKELNAECYYYEHVKSGAKLFKIANDDPNKTFGIAFKTFPDSDNGVAHIMEHSVLNGSTNFPVKSPFDVLSKGSLKTYLNASTSKDITFYPIASMNEKDYYNLMHVYLDAVFNPLIDSDPRILKQEGWHYELTGKESPVTYKGVVYNEMKGAFSTASRELRYQLYKNLFPDNAYGFESGGYPYAIPTLTQEEFTRFHDKYYHPGNSYIILYGNADMDKELAFIDTEYLSKYDRSPNTITIADQKAFSAMKDVTAYYPVMEDAKTEKQTYLCMSYVAGHNTDEALEQSLNIILELLFNQESAPGRQALEKAGIGQDISANVSNYKQNVIQITVQNAQSADKTKFLEIINKTFSDAVSKGLDKEEIKGVLNRMEFRLREGQGAQKGLSCFDQMQPGWFFANNPFQGLEYEKTLTTLKKALTTDYLEQIISKYFINNPHSLILTLEPKPGMDKERNDAVTMDLKKFKDGLSSEALEKLLTETTDLISYQKREDTPEALAKVPSLDLKDVDTKARYYNVEEINSCSVPLLFYNTFTNNIVYTTLYFDLRTLPQELIPYAALLSNLLGSLNTEKYTYGELNKQLNISTGGFNAGLRTYQENLEDSKLIPKFVVSSKAMNTQIDKLFGLTSEILLKTNFSDTERLKILLNRLQSQLDASAKRDGMSIAQTRLSSYYSNLGMLNELTSGLEYLWFVTDLSKNFDTRSSEIISKLQNVAGLLFTSANMTVSLTATKKELEIFTKQLNPFAKSFPTTKTLENKWAFLPLDKNEGILTSSKVQYVVEGYDFKKLGYSWDGKMRVLNQVISTDWLKNRVRVIGGAYGGYASISPNGTFTFNSYRDPNLRETLENYSGTVEYLNKLDFTQLELSPYIIGTIASIDKPLTPAQKGDQAVLNFFAKRTLAEIQNDRNAILSTTPENIRAYSKMLKDVIDKKNICVYGNSDKMLLDQSLFKELIRIAR